jgi:hypothetical protein
MAPRVEGIDPKQAPFAIRQVFRQVRKILGRDLTPQKIVAQVPRVFWLNVLSEWLLGERANVPQRQRMLLTLRSRPRRLSILSGREFCRWQNVRFK